MSNAYVLMTALPPTKGHLALIDFAYRLNGVRRVTVIVCTQPSEPFSRQRVSAIHDATAHLPRVDLWSYHKEISQDASKPEFWDMWRKIMHGFGMTREDIIVSSEPYGQKVADLFGAKFIPYDPARELLGIKATNVRRMPLANFDKMIPEFQRYLRRTVTLFGAESVGKTETSKALAFSLYGYWLFEYARPYLEMVGAEVTNSKMFDIFNGQEAVQRQVRDKVDRPFVFQDTDLFSTIGYWEFWKGERAPEDWYPRAHSLKSDLYVIMSQNIPFEQDILRYGGDKRESADQYWIDLCEREGLNYVVVDGAGNWEVRLTEATDASSRVFFTPEVNALQTYERKHNG